MTKSATIFRLARQIHLYLGIFFAPAILFFAITGALQTFSLHETTRGSSYVPPAWIAKMGQLHKKQTTVLPVRRPPPPAVAKPADAPAGKSEVIATTGPAPKVKNLWPMKIFFLLVAIALVISTVTGIYMTYRIKRNKLLISGLLIAGVIVPMLLTLF